MSEIRVDKIKSNNNTIVFAGITTFSGTGVFGLPGGTIGERPNLPEEGQLRYINGDLGKSLEYYDGTDWIPL
jgi:hypothetical protein